MEVHQLMVTLRGHHHLTLILNLGLTKEHPWACPKSQIPNMITHHQLSRLRERKRDTLMGLMKSLPPTFTRHHTPRVNSNPSPRKATQCRAKHATKTVATDFRASSKVKRELVFPASVDLKYLELGRSRRKSSTRVPASSNQAGWTPIVLSQPSQTSMDTWLQTPKSKEAISAAANKLVPQLVQRSSLLHTLVATRTSPTQWWKQQHLNNIWIQTYV